MTNNMKRSQTSDFIKDKDGKVLFDAISERWVEYIGELYDDERDDIPVIPNVTGPAILVEDVKRQ